MKIRVWVTKLINKGFKWPASKPRKLATVFVIFSVLGAFGWLWWNATKRPEVNFLPAISGGNWILYPKPAAGGIFPRIELSAQFQRSFVLDRIPEKADLRVAGFHRYSVSLNGRALRDPSESKRNWKSPDLFGVSDHLRLGTNEILVMVSNTNGPPGLWLSFRAGNLSLESDESWKVSLVGATWKHAQLATKPPPIIKGNGLYDDKIPRVPLRSHLLTLLFFIGSSLGLYLVQRTYGAIVTGEQTSKFRRWLPVVGVSALWLVLFVNNSGVLPVSMGYDASGHRDYISYIQEHHSLPLASDGWEMFQPPLYYLIGAGVLEILTLTVRDSAGIAALRILGLVIGISHLVIVWKSLRLLFPQDRTKQNWGLLLAAFLPVSIFLSQYISNEALAAALVSGCVYLCLRILREEQSSWKLSVGLGVCLGAALLAKSTAVLALPPVLGALAWRPILKQRIGAQSAESRISRFRVWDFAQVFVVLAACLVVCGWHYVRVWQHFGNPLIGVWDPRTGFSWWQDNGYRTGAFYLRFGRVFLHPWFSALHSFIDGLYSTLWGDGLLGGAADFLLMPPWNFNLMELGYWLALIPTIALLTGLALALRDFLRRPSAEWFLILTLGFIVAWAVTYTSIAIPYYCVVKAFYGYSALIPLCAAGGYGLERLTNRQNPDLRSSLTTHTEKGDADPEPGRVLNQRLTRFNVPIFHRFGAVTCIVLIGAWTLINFASFWIVRSSVQTRLATFRSLMKENHPLEAQQLLEQGLTAALNNADLRAKFAEILFARGDRKEAQHQAELALASNPNDPAKLSILVTTLASENPDQAIRYARQAISLAPGYSLAYQQLCALLVSQEHFDEAEPFCREGLALEPYNAALHQSLGDILIRRTEVAEAAAQLDLASKLEPDNAWTHSLLGAALEANRETSKSVSEYEAALRLQPDLAPALNDLAWIRATSSEGRLRNGAEAVRLAEQACQVTEYRETQMIGTLAAAYAEAGRFDEALKTATRARDLARTTGREDLIEKNEQLIKLFAAHQPYRQAQK